MYAPWRAPRGGTPATFKNANSLAFVAALLACAAACSESAGPAAADTTAISTVRYTVRDLTPTIGDSSTVLRLNNNGELLGIAGTSLDPAKRPFIWSDDTVRFAEGCSAAEDLNDSGAVLCLIHPGGSRVARVAIWRDGVVTPFAPFDTIEVRASQQFNDSGYVTEGTADVAGVTVCGTARYCALVVGRPTLTVMPSVVAINTTIAINTRGDVLAQGEIFDPTMSQPYCSTPLAILCNPSYPVAPDPRTT